MATSKIKFIVTDGNLFTEAADEDGVSALIFDVSTSPFDGSAIPTDGEVYRVFSLEQAVGLNPNDATKGVLPLVIDSNNTVTDAGYEKGLPHKHISDFFTVNPKGELYLGFADLSTDTSFTILNKVQSYANGRVRQMGIYTPQELLNSGDNTVNFVANIQAAADLDAQEGYNKPYSVLLHGSIATLDNGTVDVDFNKITSAETVSATSPNRVSINIGQSASNFTSQLQKNNTNVASVGSVGAMLGCVSLANVHESIGWVAKFNIQAADLSTIAFGYGDLTTIDVNNTPYEDLTSTEKDVLDNSGYIFPHKYVGLAGTFFNGEATLNTQDYRTIARNRTIDKSRRLVRLALLPTIQQPLYVDPTSGKLSKATIGQFKSIVHQSLSLMLSNGEISGFDIVIDPTQNVLSSDTLKIKYRIVPVGVNKQIEVEIGFSGSVAS